MSTPMRLSLSANAVPSPSRIWKPRNGEKLRNTPKASAAAVRRGLASIAASRSSLQRKLESTPDLPGGAGEDS
jgi:hypothetical protein